MRNFFLLFLGLLVITGCSNNGLKIGNLISLGEGINKINKTTKPITEKEEYYIGRAVAASILNKYQLLKNYNMTKYINLIGNAIAIHSERPEIYGGYHFAILNSKEVNAFAAPGGIIFLTRGLIKLTENEGELAAVIAHEISHIIRKDPIKSIKSERMKELTMFAIKNTVKMSNSSQAVKLLNSSVLDITGTLMQKGYSRSQEKKADLMAIDLLMAAGYNPHAFSSVLDKFYSNSSKNKKLKIFSTHPSARARNDYISKRLSNIAESKKSSYRKKRFLLIKKKSKL